MKIKILLNSMTIIFLLIVASFCFADGIKARLAAREPKIFTLKQSQLATENALGFLDANTDDKTALKIISEENTDRKLVYESIAKQMNSTTEIVGMRRAKMIKEQDAKSNGKPLTGVPDDIAAIIIKKCTEKWPDNFRMQKYCRDEEAKAWLDMN